jgi:hypothetical protein
MDREKVISIGSGSVMLNDVISWIMVSCAEEVRDAVVIVNGSLQCFCSKKMFSGTTNEFKYN